MNALLLVLATLAPGQARQCQTAQTYRIQQQAAVQYAQPAQAVQQYVAPVVAAQAYQAPTYAYPVVEKQIFVAVEHADPYYAALVGAQKRQEKQAAEAAGSTADLANQVADIASALRELKAQIAQIPAPASPTPKPEPAPVPTPQPTAPPTPKPAPFPAKPTTSLPATPANVLSILTTNCAKCHTGATASKGFKIFESAGKLANLAPLDLLLIDQAVYAGDMPPSGTPLDSDAYSALRAWVNDSKDDIALALKNCKTNSTPAKGN